MTLRLASGDPLPPIGYGFWKVPGETAADLTAAVLDAGYRHLDCACDYGNEAEVGRGLNRSLGRGVNRDDVWVTSKLWNTYHHPDHVAAACERSMRDLGLDYLDAYLIHFPIAQRFVDFDVRYPPGWFADPDAESPRIETERIPVLETWEAMSRLVDRGWVRTIGVCNFGTSLLRDLTNASETPVSMLQVEMHPRLAQTKLRRYAQQMGIAVTAFSPLGSPSYVSLGMADQDESLLQHPDIASIADQVGGTPAQVLLRWAIQRGTIPIPKTERRERLRENLAAVDLELTAEQIRVIDAMDRHRRYNDPGVFAEEAFNTFLPIYE